MNGVFQESSSFHRFHRFHKFHRFQRSVQLRGAPSAVGPSWTVASPKPPEGPGAKLWGDVDFMMRCLKF